MAKKILAVDDSALMRRILSDIIETDKRFVLEDTANNGLEAYDLVTTSPSKYDIIILDINMPKMNGIQFLEAINEKNIRIPVLVVSTIVKEGTEETLRCLELGAFDFLTKPDSFLETKSDKFRMRLIGFMCAALSMPLEAPKEEESRPEPVRQPSKASTFRQDAEQLSASMAKTQATASKPKPVQETKPAQEPEQEEKPLNTKKVSEAFVNALEGPMSYAAVTGIQKKPHVKVSASANRLVAIACSTGGPKALQQVIPYLPGNLAAPVLLVQHMPEGFTGTLAARLNEQSDIEVKEAVDGEIIRKGCVYIAKGGRHLRLAKKGRDYQIVLGDDPARNSLRPCADIMYESLKTLDFDEITCVVLTGMGSDGTRGIGQLCSIKNTYIIAQDELSSTVYGMPRMIKEAGITDEVVSLGSIAEAITKVVGTC